MTFREFKNKEDSLTTIGRQGMRRGGRQRMTWLDGITDSMDMSLSNSRSG